MTICLTLTLPDPALSPNARVYWRRKAEAVKDARLEACLMAVSAMNELGLRKPPRWKAATAKMRFYFKEKRRRDADNLFGSTKAHRDGLTDAGLWADDENVTHLPPEKLIDKQRPRLEIEISEIPARTGAT